MKSMGYPVILGIHNSLGAFRKLPAEALHIAVCVYIGTDAAQARPELLRCLVPQCGWFGLGLPVSGTGSRFGSR